MKSGILTLLKAHKIFSLNRNIDTGRDERRNALRGDMKAIVVADTTFHNLDSGVDNGDFDAYE